MGTDQIRSEALGLELISGFRAGLTTDHLGFCFQNQRMNPWRIASIRAIAEVLQLLRKRTILIERINPEGDQLMTTHPGQTLHDVQVLARKVLVNKQQFHSFANQMR